MIVKQHHIKQLTGAAFDFTPLVVDLYEVGRDGTVSGSPYVVPEGFVFVVKDVQLEATGQNNSVVGDLRAGTGTRWSFNTQEDSPDNFRRLLRQFKAGLVFDAGTAVNFFIPGGGSASVRVDILGYETVDV